MVESLEATLESLLEEPIEVARARESQTFDELSDFRQGIVLFGAGGLGRRTLRGLLEADIPVSALCDNNPSLWGTGIQGMTVFSPAEAAHRFGGDCVFVVTIWHAGGGHRFENSRRQLLELGCTRVSSFVPMYWKLSELFLPFYAIDLPHKVIESADEVRRAYSHFDEAKSRREFIAQVRWRLWADFDHLAHPVEEPQYFPSDLFVILRNEVFIDCGAYSGDTIRSLLQLAPDFQGQIIGFEPDPANHAALQQYVGELPFGLQERITVLQLATGRHHGLVRFAATGLASSGEDADGNVEVSCIALDDVLVSESPTYLKMDIEGAEMSTLWGARSTLGQHQPLVAVCVYHRQADLWSIPNFLHEILPNHRQFLRPHNEEGWDLICYAVPETRLLPNWSTA